jgi:hypothetical protein
MQDQKENRLVQAFRVLDPRKQLIALTYLEKEAQAILKRRPLLRVVGGSDLVDGGDADEVFHE